MAENKTSFVRANITNSEKEAIVKMAEERGMSVIEFSEFAENNTDIDKEIDKRQADLAESSENLIIKHIICYIFLLGIHYIMLKYFQ